MKRISLPVAQIRRDGGTQARVRVDEQVAGEFALAIQAGTTLPDPVVFFDGNDYWLADGFTTIRAHELIRRKQVIVMVHDGSRREAILYAVGANATHGQRRTHADLRKAVSMMLADPEWAGWPNSWIAKQCAVTEGLVRKVKREQKSSYNTRTTEVADETEDMPADVLASWNELSRHERDQVESQARADSLDERMISIETIANRLRRLMGDSDEARAALKDLQSYVDHLRMNLGWERQEKTRLDDNAIREATKLAAKLRQMHSELPGAQQAGKKLDRFLAKLRGLEKAS